ncbi:MAG: beta-lactamase family protein [Gemmatimonadetes bacterium]|nr:beta-lactamase family protein [Gemmatimonadota bacterium]MCC6771760.1 beta-lactamase family protein [Gemmatimonadaceae bacterium]
MQWHTAPTRTRSGLLRLTALLLAIIAASPTTPQPLVAQASGVRADVARDPDVLAAERLFAAWIEGQIAYRGLPGIAVGVVADQSLVWATGFGMADMANRVAMAPSTRFRMASHSKLFTATAIMQLREQGKLRLDDPVSQYLPWFRVKPAGDDDGPITIEQLLSHSSGLPREAGDHWTTMQFPTEADIKRLIVDREAPFAPQVRWKYSNLAYTIAGMVVEAVSGERWSDYVQRHIYQPLDMRASSVDRDEPGLAVGYGRRMPDGTREVLPFMDARGMAAATGISSTVEDMAKFVSAQFRAGPAGGRQILSTGSLREMHRVRSVENNWSSGTAIGFAVSRVGDRTYVGHGGGYPGYTTQTMIDLERRIGVIVLTNTNDSDPSGIARQLMRTVGDAVAKASTVREPVVAWDPAWERFAGMYRGRGGDSQVVLLNQRLVIISPNAANVDAPTALAPIGGGRFRFVAPGGGGPVGEVVRFVEENGRVVRMITGDSYVDRLR